MINAVAVKSKETPTGNARSVLLTRDINKPKTIIVKTVLVIINPCFDIKLLTVLCLSVVNDFGTHLRAIDGNGGTAAIPVSDEIASKESIALPLGIYVGWSIIFVGIIKGGGMSMADDQFVRQKLRVYRCSELIIDT